MAKSLALILLASFVTKISASEICIPSANGFVPKSCIAAVPDEDILDLMQRQLSVHAALDRKSKATQPHTPPSTEAVIKMVEETIKVTQSDAKSDEFDGGESNQDKTSLLGSFRNSGKGTQRRENPSVSGMHPLEGSPFDVKLPEGSYTVRGVMETNFNVTCFLGVPFAEPPIGDRRWRSPEPLTSPEFEILDASQMRPNCIQAEELSVMLAHPEWGSGAWPTMASGSRSQMHSSEDCLYLNVFTPISALSNKPQQLRPVLLWLPGGAYLWGGGNDGMIDGRSLASRINAVVVTSNYRLGMLGRGWSQEIANRSRDPSVSFAIQDQWAALLWVKHNIAAFGGDAARVTLGGESSAANDIWTHLQHHFSHGLFRSALVSSLSDFISPMGVANATWAWNSSTSWGLGTESWKARLNDDFLQFARTQKCIHPANGSADLPCLLSISADDLVKYFPKAIFPEPPGWLFDSQLQDPKIPVMIGWNRDDENVGDGHKPVLKLNASRQQYEEWLELIYPGSGPQLAQEHWSTDLGMLDAARKISAGYRSAMSVVTELSFACPAAAYASATKTAGTPAYVYRFDQVSTDLVTLCSALQCDGSETPEDFARLGVCHGCDIPFWFNQQARLMNAEDQRVSNTMTAYLANFLYSGNPNVGEFNMTVRWPEAVPADTRVYPTNWWKTLELDVATSMDLMVFGGARNKETATLVTMSLASCDHWSFYVREKIRREWDLLVGYWTSVIALCLLLGCFYMCSQGNPWKRAAAANPDHGHDTPMVISHLLGPCKEAFPDTHMVHQLFAEWAAQAPETIAIEIPDEAQKLVPQETMRTKLTYQEVHELVLAVARALWISGIHAGEGQIVPVMQECGVGLVVAVFGVLQAGAGWASVGIRAPESRQLMLFNDLDASTVVAPSGGCVPNPVDRQLTVVRVDGEGRLTPRLDPMWTMSSPGLSSCQSPIMNQSNVESKHVATVVFTSGSTGAPKGILYDHKMLLHGSWFFGKLVEAEPGKRFLLKTPCMWAVIEYEMFPPLIYGATMLVSHPEGYKDPSYLSKLVAEEQLHSLMITPRVLQPVLDNLREVSSPMKGFALRHCVCVGESLSASLASDFHDVFRSKGLGPLLHNCYGPSEASVTVWSHPPSPMPDATNVPGGKPQPHTSIYLFKRSQTDGTLSHVPEGEEGEIFFGGVMSLGYLNKPEETATKFVEVPGVSSKLYATGDLGRIDTGMLVVLGRIDRQLNVSGVRIEPGEVETCLRTCKDVKETVVVAVGEPQRLVAVCQAADGADGDTKSILQACAHKLPTYMLPKEIFWLSQLPSLPNGKLDIQMVQARADELAEQADIELVTDSLGMVRRKKPEAMRWQRATWWCYAYWSYGVVIDHFMRCNSNSSTCENVLYILPDRGELYVRSIGNVQDLCGFLILGAYHDAQEPLDRRYCLGLKELVLWILHLLIYALIPVFDLVTPWRTDSPNVEESNIHRWYLWMYVLARCWLCILTKLRVPAVMQVMLLIACAGMCPETGFLDACASFESGTLMHSASYFLFPSYCVSVQKVRDVSATRKMVQHPLNDDGCTCAVTGKCELFYMAVYLACFHAAPYLKKLPDYVVPLLVVTIMACLWIVLRAHITILEGSLFSCIFLFSTCLAVFVQRRTCGFKVSCVFILCISILLQLTVSAYFYPMHSFEEGKISIADTPLELLVSMMQPTLLIMAVLQIMKSNRCPGPLDIAISLVERAGKGALGTYMLHYYFVADAAHAIQQKASVLQIGSITAGVRFAYVLCVPLVFVVILGPMFQSLLFGLATEMFKLIPKSSMAGSRKKTITTAETCTLGPKSSIPSPHQEANTV